MTAQPGSFVGIDLAWGATARTGLAVVDDDGRLVASRSVRTDDEIAEWLTGHAPSIVVAAVDAPLVVPNESGSRRCEREISSLFGRYHAGAYPSNRGQAQFNPPHAATVAERFGWPVDPAEHGAVGRPVCIEVYPHPAMVSLFGLAQRIPYKKGSSAQRQLGFVELVRHLASIAVLHLEENPRWQELSRIAAQPAPGDLDRIEDEHDAILCAHLAWLWHHRPETLRIYGTLQDGYIVSPPPPAAPTPRAAPPPPESTIAGVTVTHVSSEFGVIAVDIAGRPAPFATGENERRWKEAVRAAIAGRALPPGSRIGLDIEFRLDPSQVGHNSPDLDNLLKATIDALDGLLGARPGNWKHEQADDERIDRIAASKRLAQPDETPGARLLAWEI